MLFIIVIGCFTLIYIGGAFVAAKESGKFMDRFKDKVRALPLRGAVATAISLLTPSFQVRLSEIGGISMEDPPTRSRTAASSGWARSTRRQAQGALRNLSQGEGKEAAPSCSAGCCEILGSRAASLV